jgi:hypothetical protein
LPGGSAFPRARQQIHEIARHFAIVVFLERQFQVRSTTEHMHERPHGKAAAAILLKAKLNSQPLLPALQRRGSDRAKIGGAEVAEKLVVEVPADGPCPICPAIASGSRSGLS